MKSCFLLFISIVFFCSCKRLISIDYSLNEECKTFDKNLLDSLNMKKIGVYYIEVDSEACTLTVKYEKDKVDPSVFTEFLNENNYYQQELMIEVEKQE